MSNRPIPPRKTVKPRRRFDPEFKFEAVRLAKQLGFKQAADDLGINEANLRHWAKAVDVHGSKAFASPEERGDLEAELRRLEEENHILKMERDILKKATANSRHALFLRR